MKFYMKNIRLKKHKSYSEDYKVFILNFSNSTKTLLNESNIFTKGCIIPTCNTLIKKYFGNDSKILIDIIDQKWSNGVIKKINEINSTINPNLKEKIHNLEMFYSNWGYYEEDFKKYEDLYKHYIPYTAKYLDINDLIKDMNKEFNKLYKNN